MYRFAYAEILDDAPQAPRAPERPALVRAIELLEIADAAGAMSKEAAEALSVVSRVGAMLVEDLAHPKNELPQALRTGLISIGLAIISEADRMKAEKAPDFRALIDIMTSIAAGLA